MEKPSYYSILTADVRYDKGLKPNEKLLFSEVTALSNKSGYCHAGNKYFADLYGVTKQTVSVWVNHLKKSGYVQIEIIKDGNRIKERRIYPTSTPIKKNLNTYKEKDDGGIKKNLNTPIKKNLKENITRDNTTSINNNSQAKPDKGSTHLAERKEIIEYLNHKLGTNYKVGAKTNARHINARLNKGYTVDDFKKVIDIKYDDWANNPKMAKYLRPGTLFKPDKFENYLNEWKMSNAQNSPGHRDYQAELNEWNEGN